MHSDVIFGTVLDCFIAVITPRSLLLYFFHCSQGLPTRMMHSDVIFGTVFDCFIAVITPRSLLLLCHKKNILSAFYTHDAFPYS